jgi:hypothetical protein
MQMKMREMGMKNRNFKKSYSYSSKKIESKIEIVGPPLALLVSCWAGVEL